MKAIVTYPEILRQYQDFSDAADYYFFDEKVDNHVITATFNGDVKDFFWLFGSFALLDGEKVTYERKNSLYVTETIILKGN